ncbi:hypothetical protein [Alicycliphilus denitrificans]|uniref:hypothetical protein n=1 Tax=Alicycliphilus denitrificans TaxID=179636 RepID=UPI000C9FE985|nr:hypothetical protein [Alicycliphilus denitrificans]
MSSDQQTTKKTVLVTITKEIEVEIKNDMLTPEALAEFSKFFYEACSPDEMFANAAQQIARFEPSFVEGLGPCRPAHSKDDAVVRYQEISEDVEAEVKEPSHAG